jgi:ubiquinone/menaquinone biosynthesis C-methylase UbiE
MSAKGEVEELFTKTVDDWARFYDDQNPPTLTAQNLVSRMRFTLEMLGAAVQPGSKVLDVGCGAGQLVAELNRRGYEAWGVDISEAMVNHAREQYESDRFRVADIEQLPFSDNSFDGIVCLGVLEYLNQDDAALREMWRVLKPGGRAIITTPSSICPFYYMDRLYQKIRFLVRPVARGIRYGLLKRPRPASRALPAVVHRRYSQRSWVEVLQTHGLELEDWVCHTWGWYSLEWILRQGPLCRASDRFARNPWMNWLASDQIACVRARK